MSDAKSDSKEPHVRFDSSIDPEAEEERSARGQQHRKDLVLGIRWHKETEKTMRIVQMKDGYEFVQNLKDYETLSQKGLGIKLTVEGFLSFFHAQYSDVGDNVEDMKDLLTYFQGHEKPVEDLGPKLQEHLIVIALHTAEDDYYGLPDAESVGTAMVDSGDESDSAKKPRLDKP